MGFDLFFLPVRFHLFKKTQISMFIVYLQRSIIPKLGKALIFFETPIREGLLFVEFPIRERLLFFGDSHVADLSEFKWISDGF